MGGEGDMGSLDIRSVLLFIEEKVDVSGVLILLLSVGGCQFSIFSFSNSDFLFLVLTFGFSKISTGVVASSISPTSESSIVMIFFSGMMTSSISLSRTTFLSSIIFFAAFLTAHSWLEIRPRFYETS